MGKTIVALSVKDDVYVCMKVEGDILPSKLGILLLEEYSGDNGNNLRRVIEVKENFNKNYKVEFLGDIYTNDGVSKLCGNLEDKIDYVYTLDYMNKWGCRHCGYKVSLPSIKRYVEECGTHDSNLGDVEISISDIDYDIDNNAEPYVTLDTTYRFEASFSSGPTGHFFMTSSTGEIETNDGVDLKHINPYLRNVLKEIFHGADFEVVSLLEKIVQKMLRKVDYSGKIEIEA